MWLAYCLLTIMYRLLKYFNKKREKIYIKYIMQLYLLYLPLNYNNAYYLGLKYCTYVRSYITFCI